MPSKAASMNRLPGFSATCGSIECSAKLARTPGETIHRARSVTILLAHCAEDACRLAYG